MGPAQGLKSKALKRKKLDGKFTALKKEKKNRFLSILDNEDVRLRNVWCNKAVVDSKYEDHRSKSLTFFELFAYVWYSFLAHSTTARHRIDLTNDAVHPVQSKSSKAGPTTKEFAATETNKVLQEEVIETAKTW